MNTKYTTLENSVKSTLIIPALLATPYPRGGAQTQKSPLGPACRSDSAGRDLGVSYKVGSLRLSLKQTKEYNNLYICEVTS